MPTDTTRTAAPSPHSGEKPNSRTASAVCLVRSAAQWLADQEKEKRLKAAFAALAAEHPETIGYDPAWVPGGAA